MHSIDNLSSLGEGAEKRAVTGIALGAGLAAASKVNELSRNQRQLIAIQEVNAGLRSGEDYDAEYNQPQTGPSAFKAYAVAIIGLLGLMYAFGAIFY